MCFDPQLERTREQMAPLLLLLGETGAAGGRVAECERSNEPDWAWGVGRVLMAVPCGTYKIAPGVICGSEKTGMSFPRGWSGGNLFDFPG